MVHDCFKLQFQHTSIEKTDISLGNLLFVKKYFILLAICYKTRLVIVMQHLNVLLANFY